MMMKCFVVVYYCFRGFVYLSNLLHPVDMTRRACLVNERGDVIGHIKVAVQAVTGLPSHFAPPPSHYLPPVTLRSVYLALKSYTKYRE